MRMIDNEIILMTMLNFNNDDGKLNKMKQTKKKKKCYKFLQTKYQDFLLVIGWICVEEDACFYLLLLLSFFDSIALLKSNFEYFVVRSLQFLYV